MNEIDKVLKKYDSILLDCKALSKVLGDKDMPGNRYVECVDRLAGIYKNCKEQKSYLLKTKLKRKIRNNEVR